VRAGLSILVLAALSAALWGCGREHTELTGDEFPAPLLDALIIGEETVRLDWSYEGAPDLYHVYLGAFAWDEELGIVENDTLIDSTETAPLDLTVEGLTDFVEELGDTLYRFVFFRVAPYDSDGEGLRSPRAFPHR